MSWTDEELDKLFSDSAGDMTFEYKKEYFKDIEKYLPISGKRDFLWNGVSLFMGALVVYLMIQPTSILEIESALESRVQLAQKTNVSSDHEIAITGTSVKNDHHETVVICKGSENLLNSTIESYNEGKISTADQLDNNKFDIVNPDQIKGIQHLEVLAASNLTEIEFESFPSENFEYVDRIDVTPRIDFFVQGIGGIGQGKMLPGEKASKLTGFGIGAEFNRKRLTASIALNGMVSHHDGMELSRLSKVYGFGSTEYKSTIVYSKLYIAESDITIGYRMGRVVAFGGLNVNYLASTECTITNSDLKDPASYDVRKEYGYTTGLKNWGLKPMAGVSYDFKNKMQLGANIGAQVIETVQQEYLEGVSRPLPLEGRFYLRWKF